jgi:protein O-GlcNAc transferase
VKIDKRVNKALKLQQDGHLLEAGELFCQILKKNPFDFAALHSMGVVALLLKGQEKALEYLDRAININPNFAPTWHNRALALQKLGRNADALRSCEEALKIDPGFRESIILRDALVRESNAPPSGELPPELAAKLAQLSQEALGLQHAGRASEAEAMFLKVLEQKPWDFVSLYSLGVIAQQKGEPLRALDYFDATVKGNPQFAPNWYNRGSVLQALKRSAEALEDYDRALQIDPRYCEALVNRGAVLQEMDRHHEALENYDRLLEFAPDNDKALGNKGILLTEFKRYDEASDTFEKLLKVNPDFNYGPGLLCFANMHSCNWAGFAEMAEKLGADVRAGKSVTKTLGLLACSDSPEEHLLCSRIFARNMFPVKEPLWRGERYRHEKIRIAYLSPDFREHPVGHLTAGIFEAHDRSRFETIAISLGIDDKSALRSRIALAFDRFIDVRQKNSADIAALLRSLEVDIVVDLAGYTADSRTAVLSYRPAPIQVNYLGYPSTLGVDYLDYILADRQVIPEEHRQYFDEQVVYLPDTYLPTDSALQIASRTPTREEFGLPSEGFVFCSFNHAYKINPTVFDAWMRILEKVPGSVLWLMKLNNSAEGNLRREAEARGIDPARIIFATRVPKVEDHLARYRLAGLFLDTTPYNAHTTASDALFAGLPVLTYLGNAFPGRVAAGLLNAIGLPELVTHSLEAYENAAVALALDAPRLQEIRNRLLVNRETRPLFDTKRMCRNLESAYLGMWERWQRGEAPESFSVEAPSPDQGIAVAAKEAASLPDQGSDVATPSPARESAVTPPSPAQDGLLHLQGGALEGDGYSWSLPATGSIVVDGVFFQLAGSGIARVWMNLLEEWSRSGFGQRIVILDRGRTPRFAGLRYLDTPPLNYADLEGDRKLLQQICDREQAELFISTYYTTPLKTKSVLLLYDMIPELFGMDMNTPQWSQKTQAIRYASHYITISKSTAVDLLRNSDKEAYDLAIAHCGCNFHPPAKEEVALFLKEKGIDRPYFMLSGSRNDYKNAVLFFAAFARFGDRRKEFAIVCTGGDMQLEEQCAVHVGEAQVHLLRVTDQELQCAYGGALALVYPSLYEGFGMPPLEAMACGSPVITTPKASLPEVCGDAVIYVDPDRPAVEEMYRALLDVLDPGKRQDLVEKGFRQAAGFSWSNMARTIAANLSRWYPGAKPEAVQVPAAAAPQPLPLQQSVEIAFGLFNAGDLAGAGAVCAGLIDQQVKNFYPFYLSGLIAGQGQNWSLARRHLQEALELSEGVPAARVAEVTARLAELPQG